VSPDGKFLADEQGGLRVLDLATGESRMVRDEETEYRMEPAWTPDGQNILYVTEDEGSNDIRIVSAAGGDAIELTNDTTRHEMSPSVSPDGTKLAPGARCRLPSVAASHPPAASGSASSDPMASPWARASTSTRATAGTTRLTMAFIDR
jgi:hypothetical protein